EAGVHELAGDVVIGADPTRDGIYRAMVPIAIKAGTPGEPPVVTTPAGYDLVTVKNGAKTRKGGGAAALSYKTESVKDEAGRLHVVLSVTGTIGNGAPAPYQMPTTERTAHAAHALRAALRARHVDVYGDIKIEELGEFIGDAVAAGALPVELARHESVPLAQIVAH